MRVLGIDPGTNTVGYAILEKEGSRIRLCESGVIRTGRGQPIEKRLLVIHDSLQEVIRRTRPDEAAVEEVVHGRSIRSALRSGEGRGVAILAAGSCGIPVEEYSPTKVKKAATGSGNAGKAMVQEMVSRILGLQGRPTPDEADAMAIALCHCQRRRTGA